MQKCKHSARTLNELEIIHIHIYDILCYIYIVNGNESEEKIMKIVKVKMKDNQGKTSEKDAIEVGIVDNIDKWSSVTLVDGTVIRHQHPVVKVLKVIGEQDQEGHPIFLLNHSSILTVNVADDLKNQN